MAYTLPHRTMIMCISDSWMFSIVVRHKFIIKSKRTKMKNLFLIFLTSLILKVANGQIASFKINNQLSGKVNKDKVTKVYTTLEIINYNYLNKIKNEKQAELKRLEDQLMNNSNGTDGKPVFDQGTISSKSTSIKKIRIEISKIKSDQDSLYYIYTKDYLNFKKVRILGFGPVRSRAFFDMVYSNGGKRFRALGNAGVSFGNNSGSLYSEIVSGNLGLFRVSLGTMLSNSKNQDENAEKKEEAYQRLVNYGGNTVINFEYPLAYLHSNNNQYNFISRFIAKGTADFPAFGTNTEEWAGSGVLGIDFYGDASLSNDALKFFFNFNVNKIYGTKEFINNLGINKNNFTFGQLSLGLVFLENFKISFIVSTFSSEKGLRNRNVVAGGQVLR